MFEYNIDAVISEFNETDVREEFLAPIVKEMGYSRGSENNVERERTLRYPKLFLGRKKSTDPEINLQGRADYICTASNNVCWVIEAKPPNEDISNFDAIEQAWAYANHPEIRAVYFCLCNGINLKIYLTNRGANSDPIAEFDMAELPDRIEHLKSILSPASILRDHPEYEPDYGRPLADGLKSLAHITRGKIVYRQNSHNLPSLNGMIMTIHGGHVQRTEDHNILAHIKTTVQNAHLQELNELLGLDVFDIETEDDTISTDASDPTTFKSLNSILMPRGLEILDLQSWQKILLPMDVNVETITTASGYLTERTFHGNFEAEIKYIEFGMSIEMSGDFEVDLHNIIY